MKLVVLVPAFNEEKTIEQTILQIPRKISGIDKVEVLVVNDGSKDQTIDMALNGGADKVVSHNKNMGVGAAFMTGIRNAIIMNADIVVTIDADLQLDPNEIHDIVLPIVNKQSDIVIGSRFTSETPINYPRIKKLGNKIFSSLVSFAIGQKISDTQSGFRAYSKNTLLAISIINDFTYTQEVLIDLKFKGYRISEVPISVRHYRKDSRVVKNIFSYSLKALSIIAKSLVYHRPVLAFGLFGMLLISTGLISKFLTINKILIVSAGLSTGLIILGIVAFMMGMFANIVFKRQLFAERDLRHYVNEFKSKDGLD